MAIKYTVPLDMLSTLIKEAVKSEIEAVIKTEADEAANRVRNEVSKSVDRIALNVFGCYDLSYDRDRLIISIKKPTEDE